MLQNASLLAIVAVHTAENEPCEVGAAEREGHQARLRRLVLGRIEADFRVQIRILQHFSKSTRKSSSREQILQISAKKVQNFAKCLTFFSKFCKILQIFQESAKFLQNFAEFLAEFYRNL